jgi:Ser/Thr protein kinase RdoA (MazF antagonist)
LPANGDDYGLIHGDFELDNLPWGDDGPSVIDFDEAGMSWMTADIAFAVRDLVEAGEDVTSPRLAAFLRGYAKESPLPAMLLVDLPRFNQWARLTTLARITYARAQDDSGFPDWARDLNERLDELAATCQAGILAAASSPDA